MSLLIRAGLGFKKAWKDIMQFALLSRSEAATSNKFYALKKPPACVCPEACSAEQKKKLLSQAFSLLRFERENALTNESIATLEGMEARATASYLRWKEFDGLQYSRDEELTEEQRQRKRELYSRLFKESHLGDDARGMNEFD